MIKGKKWFPWVAASLILCILLVGSVIIWVLGNPTAPIPSSQANRHSRDLTAPAPIEKESSTKSPGSGVSKGQVKTSEPGYADVGGVKRKATDVASMPEKVKNTSGKTDSSKSQDIRPVYGQTPAIDLTNPHPQTLSVLTALRDGKHPERLSPVIQPQAFDLKQYQESQEYAQKYLATAEPGRVFQSAQPESNIAQIQRVSPRYVEIKQGEAIELSVRATKQMPVTFTSFDLGQFSNQLTTITVKADDSGVARASFKATTGTLYDVKILAASPVHSGQVKFVVHVKPAKSL